MRTIQLIIVLFLVPAAHAGAEDVLSKILFGSCIKQEKPIPILETIVSAKPDAFIFLGDNIYADTEDMDVMLAKYKKLKADPNFSRLLNLCPVLATWDDHDYGVNDGGAEYTKKAEAQKIFVDFWNDPEDSPRRSRPGVYDSRIFGPEGKRVQIILLDTRYFRGPLKTGERRTGGKYYPANDPAIPLLGEAQWSWLEQELQKPAEIRIIGSGIQIVPEASGQETWANLPYERQRLFDLIAKTKANGVFLISGDRHWSEFSRTTEKTPYPIYDFTSSSLNQIHPRGTPTDNQYRISKSTFHKENFGEILIKWAGQDTRIEVRILDIEGTENFGHTVSLSELQ
ncbi:MAG: alkaline phosphatase D family protein [Verrucomicrobiales bacterium]|nr:alkaline phosphatase D family protein [Verrucomicrobiales bacterium]